jgi:hypothetical protein
MSLGAEAAGGISGGTWAAFRDAGIDNAG